MIHLYNISRSIMIRRPITCNHCLLNLLLIKGDLMGVGIKHFVRNTNTKYFTLVWGIFTIIKQGSVIVTANH